MSKQENEPQKSQDKGDESVDSSTPPAIKSQRRSGIVSALAAFSYLTRLADDEKINIRSSDRVTSIALLVVSILTVLSLATQPLAGIRVQMVFLCDFLVGLVLFFYIVNRFGIIDTIPPRQALLTWQLMLAAGFVGVWLTINTAVIVALSLSNSTIMLH